MSKARAEFWQRVATYRSAAAADTLVSRAPTELEHNARAQMLRNGIAVIGYAVLEDFVRNRTAEVLQRLSGGVAPFHELPIGIRDAATAGVVRALNFRQRFLDRGSSDYHKYYQDHGRAIGSTATAAYEISVLAFASDGSNIRPDSLREILDAFQIDGGWSAIGSVASRCNIGVLDLKSAMVTAERRRHAAAHQASTVVEASDLVAFGTELIGIAVGFDLLLSKALRRLLDRDQQYLTYRTKVAAKDVTVRTIEHRGGWWREVSPGRSRAVRRSHDVTALKADCVLRSRANGDAVVVKGGQGLPVEWFTPELG